LSSKEKRCRRVVVVSQKNSILLTLSLVTSSSEIHRSCPYRSFHTGLEYSRSSSFSLSNSTCSSECFCWRSNPFNKSLLLHSVSSVKSFLSSFSMNFMFPLAKDSTARLSKYHEVSLEVLLVVGSSSFALGGLERRLPNRSLRIILSITRFRDLVSDVHSFP
jgi:hypothetical protein